MASSSPEYEQNPKYAMIEFDDGDSGRIAIKDIRFLTNDYPVVGKKKRIKHFHFDFNYNSIQFSIQWIHILFQDHFWFNRDVYFLN